MSGADLTVTVLTAFPAVLEHAFHEGILERAQKAGKIEARAVDLRSFAHDRHRTLDDTPYGGGAGMLLMAPPVLEALDAVGAGRPRPGLLRVLLAPDGARFDQTTAVGWARELDHLVLVCGRYEGIDERVRRHVDKVVSLGDFVLMGGEAAAWAIAEAVLRLIPGVVEERSLSEESFCEGLLEGPQYTRPPHRVTGNTETTEPGPVQDDAPRKAGEDADMLGASSGRLVEAVPEILRSGDHGRVARAKRRAALARTLIARPDLLREAPLGEVDVALMGEVVVTVGRTIGSGRGEDTADRAASISSDDWVERMLY